MLDLLGLTDRYLAHHPPADFGEGFIGHELGNGPYVLSRQPDILMFGQLGSEGAWFRSGIELARLPAFSRDYLPIRYKTFGLPLATFWMRWASPRIGVTISPREIRVPGLFFATGPHAIARIAYGRPVAHLTAGGTSTFDRLPLDRGSWTARVSATGPAIAAIDGHVVRVTAGANDCEIAEVVLTAADADAGSRATAPR